jgi:hypothetical protein
MCTFHPLRTLAFDQERWTLEHRFEFCFIMSTYRIFYLRGGGLLDDAEEVACDDLVTAAKAASSKHPQLTAEIWSESKKVAVVRPCPPHALKR